MRSSFRVHVLSLARACTGSIQHSVYYHPGTYQAAASGEARDRHGNLRRLHEADLIHGMEGMKVPYIRQVYKDGEPCEVSVEDGVPKTVSRYSSPLTL